MKILNNNYIFGVIVLIVIGFNYVQANQLKNETPDNAFLLQNTKSAIIIDAREESEQKSGRIKSALSLPISVMDNNKNEFEKIISTYPKDKNLIVYCRSGRRSGILGAELEKRGFKVFNLGGFDSWKNKGLPIE